jgi:hypothetical protein
LLIKAFINSIGIYLIKDNPHLMYSVEKLVQKADKETALMILLCRIYLQTATAEEVNAFLTDNIIDDERFYYIVKQNSLRPLISQVIKHNGINISPSIKERLFSASKSFVFTSLSHLNETARLVNLFKQNGVTVIPYKGVTFANQYYGNLSLRESSDIDFLVPKHDISSIQELIYTDGYKSPPEYYYCKPSYHYNHSPSLDVNNDTKTQRNIHLEFHYHIISQDFGMCIDNLQLMRNPASVNVSGKELNIPSNDANCKIILTHHGLDDIWLSLKYYLDLAVICKSDESFDWNDILKFCREYGFYNNALVGFKNMESLLGIKSPVNVGLAKEKLRLQILDVFFLHDQYKERFLTKTLLRIKSRDGLKWRSKMIWSLFKRFLRPKDLDFKMFNLPRALYPLYYIIKPLRVFYRFTIGPIFFGEKNNAIFR